MLNNTDLLRGRLSSLGRLICEGYATIPDSRRKKLMRQIKYRDIEASFEAFKAVWEEYKIGSAKTYMVAGTAEIILDNCVRILHFMKAYTRTYDPRRCGKMHSAISSLKHIIMLCDKIKLGF